MIASLAAVVPSHLDGSRFDIAAAELFSPLSRKKIKEIIDAGGAYCRKRRVMIAKHEVRAGDKIEVFWEERAEKGRVERDEARIASIRSAIIYECQDFLVINKPAGIPSQATLISSTDTILHAIAAADPQKFPLEALHLVHRLDKDTSGLMMVARNKGMQKKIEESFRLGQVQKQYEALCFGAPKVDEGRIVFPIAPDRSRKNTWMPIFGKGKVPDAKEAETLYKVRESYRSVQASAITCFPKTGRTHQIRVHLMAIGCPILGDKTYSNNVVGHATGQLALRQMLHAQGLKIDIAGVGSFQWEAPLPADFCEVEAALRRLNGA
jgi:23S rRNA pseudouridine1911/1915/1917 synthase